MPRLAWFTPLPPSRSGIAAYSADVLPHVARLNQVDVFVDPGAPTSVNLGLPVFSSREFVWRHRARPYDLAIYQLGNAACHDYMWPYLVRFPGMVVLHDAQLHHARSRALLTSGRKDDYRAEFRFCHPDANPGVAEIVAAALGGSLYFFWPLVRVPVDSSRLVAVHTPWLADHLRETYPNSSFAVINMGVADPRPTTLDQRPTTIRARHHLPPERVVFAAYGMLTPEKRLTEILAALRGVLPYAPESHLLLVGQPVDYYDVEAIAHAYGVADHVTVTGYVEDSDLPEYLTAADVCLCLRWPTSRETSASWLRCLAAGKPTVITDLVHTCSVPALDPRGWEVLERYDPADAPATADLSAEALAKAEPVCVAVDIVDEQHSLGLAMRRLATDAALREELGHRARVWWERHHTVARMAADYQRAIETAIARPAPDRAHLPAHLIKDGTELTAGILGDFGLSLTDLDWTRMEGATKRSGA